MLQSPDQTPYLKKLLKDIAVYEKSYALTYHAIAKFYERDVIPTTASVTFAQIAMNKAWRADISNQEARELSVSVMNMLSIGTALHMYRSLLEYFVKVCDDLYTHLLLPNNETVDKSWFHKDPFNMIELITGTSPRYSPGFEFVERLERMHERMTQPGAKDPPDFLASFDQAALQISTKELREFVEDFEAAVRIRNPKWKP
jgi:hypothetical protein